MKHPSLRMPLAALIFAFSLAVCVFPAPPIQSEFDAASIKSWKPASGGGGNRSGGGLPAPDGGHLQYSPGRVATPWTGVTVKRIIQEAYGFSNYRVSGGPAWIDTDKFKLEARSTDPSADEGQLRLMLRTLLSKRFHLEFRRETRQIPVYALTVAKGGAKIREWKESGNPDATRAALQAEFAKGADDASITNMATFVDRMNSDRTNIHRRMIGVDRPVVDKTGLSGIYLIALQPIPEQDYKTVVENQLGLKFIPQKAMVDTLVIERIEKPDPN